MVFAPKVGVSPIGKHRLNSLTVIFRRLGDLIYKKVYILLYNNVRTGDGMRNRTVKLLNFKYKKSTPGRMDFPKCLEL